MEPKQDNLQAFETALRQLVPDPEARVELLKAVVRLLEETCQRPQ